MTDDFYVLELCYAVVLREGHGEEQFVVFSPVERTGGEVHVKLLGSHSGEVVDGDTLFVDAATHIALLAEVLEFRGESVAHVHH